MSGNYEYTYYLEDCSYVTGEKPTAGVIAVSGKNIAGGSDNFYILISGGAVFDPFNTDVWKRRGVNKWVLRRVQKPAFDNYLLFLSTKKKLYKTICERNI